MTFEVGKVSAIFEENQLVEADSLEKLLEQLKEENDIHAFIVHLPQKNIRERTEVLVYDGYYE